MLSSGGASQPAVNLNVGTFNVGIMQAMLESKKHREHFRRLLGKAFEEGDLHLLSLCEVGGHKQGLKTAFIHPQALLDGVLPHQEYRAAAMQAPTFSTTQSLGDGRQAHLPHQSLRRSSACSCRLQQL
jgi:hypothetical protein